MVFQHVKNVNEIGTEDIVVVQEMDENEIDAMRHYGEEEDDDDEDSFESTHSRVP